MAQLGRAEQTSPRDGMRRDRESSQWGHLCLGNCQTGPDRDSTDLPGSLKPLKMPHVSQSH